MISSKKVSWGASICGACVLLLLSAAAMAEASRWAQHVVPVFHPVADSNDADSGAPYAADVLALAQDATGFIWIGGEHGLQRWDGNRLRNYFAQPGDECALPTESVFSLHADDRHRLWIGTFGGGLARYDPDTDCIRPINADALRGASVWAIVSDGGEGLWLATFSGLVHLDADLIHATRVDPQSGMQGGQTGGRIGALLRDRSGALWVGAEHGLFRLGASQSDFESIPFPREAAIRALVQGADGRIWVGTVSNGAYVIDPATLQVQGIDAILRQRPVPEILRIVQAPDGDIWLGTPSAGILVVDAKALTVRVLRHEMGVALTLDEDSVRDMLRDRDGLIWVATREGVGYFHTGDATATILFAEQSNRLPEGRALGMVLLSGDRVGVGIEAEIAVIAPFTAGGERIRIDTQPAPAEISAMASLDGHSFFAAGAPMGVAWVDPAAHRSIRVPLPGIDGIAHVAALAVDGNRVWAGAQEGLWLIEPQPGGTRTPVAWQGRLVSDAIEVEAIAIASRELRWLGGVGGLFVSEGDGTAARRVQLEDASGAVRPEGSVTTLYADRHGRLWVGTVSNGLFLVDPSGVATGRVRILKQFLGELPSGAVNSILEDDRQDFWIAAEQGIARIEGGSYAVHRLGRGDGVALSSFVNEVCADQACSELMFGGRNGITLVRPARLPAARQPPPVVITRLSAGHRELPASHFNSDAADPVVEVPAEDRSLTVEFAVLDYADPAHDSYEYRLENYDRGWLPTGFDSRMAMYTNMPAGTYRLRLRGSDHTGEWSARERQILVHVLPAWYQTLWFRLLAALTVGIIVMLIVQARTALLRARQRELEGIVVERTQALLGATAARNALIENLAHDLRTPLTSMRGYLDRLSLKDATLPEAEREQCISIAVRQTDRLGRLVQELFDLVRLSDAAARLKLESFSPADIVQDLVREFAPMAEQRTLQFHCRAGAEAVQIVADIGLFQRLVENLVENAIRHTSMQGRVDVSVAVEGDQLSLAVQDNGRGIEPQYLEHIFERYERSDHADQARGAGLGLAIVKRIVDLHHGSVSVASRVNEGACFTVRLPLRGPAAAAGIA